MNKKPYLETMPDQNGYFGKFGGAYIPPQLEKPFEEITKAYNKLSKSHTYISELRSIRKHYQGRPTPVYYCKNLSEFVGGGQIYLKREDLNHTGAHKLNHCMAEGLLAKYLGKKKLIAETGEHSASLTYGKEGIMHGFNSIMLTDEKGEPAAVHSIASGIDYPSIGPEHAYLSGRGDKDIDFVVENYPIPKKSN